LNKGPCASGTGRQKLSEKRVVLQESQMPKSEGIPMMLNIEPHKARWLLVKDGVPVFSGSYRQVEDWLDLTENCSAQTKLSKSQLGSLISRVVSPQKGEDVCCPCESR
jgi:hypothetical protein